VPVCVTLHGLKPRWYSGAAGTTSLDEFIQELSGCNYLYILLFSNKKQTYKNVFSFIFLSLPGSIPLSYPHGRKLSNPNDYNDQKSEKIRGWET
jgi:hypothetical protein